MPHRTDSVPVRAETLTILENGGGKMAEHRGRGPCYRKKYCMAAVYKLIYLEVLKNYRSTKPLVGEAEFSIKGISVKDVPSPLLTKTLGVDEQGVLIQGSACLSSVSECVIAGDFCTASRQWPSQWACARTVFGASSSDLRSVDRRRRMLNNREEDGGACSIPLLPRGDAKVSVQRPLTHLPKRPRVDIAFSNLTYTVKEGTKKSESFI
ncbi:hypothetical protein J437_LFUL014420 [Ladona fulva]|uniref:Uncharacterized protein n=1 Tax=Ladona fulva TaxID=123851 RepID=A0A8K0NXK7_LADFU|nr:hypothetical protein J437_LFUL014420 [Ladona fulva]